MEILLHNLPGATVDITDGTDTQDRGHRRYSINNITLPAGRSFIDIPIRLNHDEKRTEISEGLVYELEVIDPVNTQDWAKTGDQYQTLLSIQNSLSQLFRYPWSWSHNNYQLSGTLLARADAGAGLLINRTNGASAANDTANVISHTLVIESLSTAATLVNTDLLQTNARHQLAYTAGGEEFADTPEVQIAIPASANLSTPTISLFRYNAAADQWQLLGADDAVIASSDGLATGPRFSGDEEITPTLPPPPPAPTQPLDIVPATDRWFEWSWEVGDYSIIGQFRVRDRDQLSGNRQDFFEGDTVSQLVVYHHEYTVFRSFAPLFEVQLPRGGRRFTEDTTATLVISSTGATFSDFATEYAFQYRIPDDEGSVTPFGTLKEGIDDSAPDFNETVIANYDTGKVDLQLDTGDYKVGLIYDPEENAARPWQLRDHDGNLIESSDTGPGVYKYIGIILVDPDATTAAPVTTLPEPETTRPHIGPFEMEWNVFTAGYTLTIPTRAGQTYDYSVDWGDGETTTGHTGDATHTYTQRQFRDHVRGTGGYRIKITGTFPAIHMGKSGLTSEYKELLLGVHNWGAIAWKTMRGAFTGATALELYTDDTPNLSGVTDLSGMFHGCDSMTGVTSRGSVDGLEHWDTSTITDMSDMFRGTVRLYARLSSWDTSNVMYMARMFSGASNFNGDISGWNTGRVADMTDMFGSARRFNQNISRWNTRSVTNLSGMFHNASAFNQTLAGWDIANVTDASRMLLNTAVDSETYNQLLAGWGRPGLPRRQTVFNAPAGITFDGSGAGGRVYLTNAGWTIHDGGQHPRPYLVINKERLNLTEIGEAYNATINAGTLDISLSEPYINDVEFVLYNTEEVETSTTLVASRGNPPNVRAWFSNGATHYRGTIPAGAPVGNRSKPGHNIQFRTRRNSIEENTTYTYNLREVDGSFIFNDTPPPPPNQFIIAIANVATVYRRYNWVWYGYPRLFINYADRDDDDDTPNPNIRIEGTFVIEEYDPGTVVHHVTGETDPHIGGFFVSLQTTIDHANNDNLTPNSGRFILHTYKVYNLEGLPADTTDFSTGGTVVATVDVINNTATIGGFANNSTNPSRYTAYRYLLGEDRFSQIGPLQLTDHTDRDFALPYLRLSAQDAVFEQRVHFGIDDRNVHYDNHPFIEYPYWFEMYFLNGRFNQFPYTVSRQDQHPVINPAGAPYLLRPGDSHPDG